MKTISSNYTPLEDSQYLLQRLSRETNSNINTSRLCSTYNQAHNQVFLKAKTKMSSKKYYKTS